MKNPSVKDYDISSRIEAGLILSAAQVKAIATKKANISGAYCRQTPESFKINGFTFLSTPEEVNLLLNKREIRWLHDRIKKGDYIIPEEVYLKGRKFKISLGVGRKIRKGDRRAKEKEKEARQEIKNFS